VRTFSCRIESNRAVDNTWIGTVKQHASTQTRLTML